MNSTSSFLGKLARLIPVKDAVGVPTMSDPLDYSRANRQGR